MSEIRIRKRHRLREKEVKSLADNIYLQLGVEPFQPGDSIDQAESSDFGVLFVGNSAEGIVFDGKPFLTVRGLLKHPASKSFVIVDMGAVPFVTKGADVMAPGIVDVDRNIKIGDLVWVKDVKNGRPIAIGKALMDGPIMASKAPGKAIKNIHFVGDKLWKVDEDS